MQNNIVQQQKNEINYINLISINKLSYKNYNYDAIY